MACRTAKRARPSARRALEDSTGGCGLFAVAEAFLLAGAAFQQLLGRLFGGLTFVVELAADDVFTLGLTLGFVGPGVLWVACLVWALRRVSTARWAWWIPVVGTLALALLFFLAGSIAQSGVPV